MPQRVKLSTSCSTITIASAQISSEYMPPPKTLANVVISPMTAVPGVATGCASEMISVKPVEREQHAERGDERVDARRPP